MFILELFKNLSFTSLAAAMITKYWCYLTNKSHKKNLLLTLEKPHSNVHLILHVHEASITSSKSTSNIKAVLGLQKSSKNFLPHQEGSLTVLSKSSPDLKNSLTRCRLLTLTLHWGHNLSPSNTVRQHLIQHTWSQWERNGAWASPPHKQHL